MPNLAKRVLVLVGAVVVLAAAGVGLTWWQGDRGGDAAARTALGSFADHLVAGDLATAGPPLADRAAGAASDAQVASLAPVSRDAQVTSSSLDGDRAVGTVHLTWGLPGGATWEEDVRVEARRAGGAWTVAPPGQGSYLSPDVAPDETLAAERTLARRGDLVGRGGEPLMPLGTVYPVQLDPARAGVDTARRLAALVDEPAGPLVERLRAAKASGSKAPVPVVTYRERDFQQRRARLDALPGVIYPRTEQPLARTRTFGQPLLGSFGEVTAEIVQASDGRYAPGDRAGLSGLQRQYDGRLAGTPGVRVVSSGGTTLFTKDPVPGKDVQLALDPKVEGAAESALAATGDVPSALVAVDVTSGDVLAAANRPAFGFDRALSGQFPPGSTFKVASTYALLTGNHVTPTTRVSCPKATVVDGMRVRNFEGETLGSPTFAEDFHHSCNTAFVQLADRLGPGDLSSAATALGVGTGWADALGVADAFDGSVPENTGATDQAAATIGQGRDLASPVALAVMAGSVARGSYVQPALVTAPEPAGVDRAPRRLDATAVGHLRELMRGVVTDGTGTALQGAPGGPVSGKTGTAEFGTQDPPETHAWFIGWQGDVAFAVLVERGRSGGAVAAPIAKDFLTRLARG